MQRTATWERGAAMEVYTMYLAGVTRGATHACLVTVLSVLVGWLVSVWYNRGTKE